ncbi:MAG: NAD(P)-dependent glycerol-3-phosphate dehydrogenase [Deltaproteobacteria bacterium]|nr:NAD(P)-dependent glycerol-3-phosphate dehydrogenase [Deltaproteobacteria bacterium]
MGRCKMAILGAGNLGTTLALMMWEKGHRVTLWTVEEDVAEAIMEGRENPRYLPGHYIPEEIDVSLEIAEALREAEIIALAVPSHAVREVARRVVPHFSPEAIIVDFAKGMEVKTGLRMSQVIESELSLELRDGIVAVSGPSIASELARKLPTAVEISSREPIYAQKAKEILETPFFRLYVNEDLAGVELGGVFKNVFAIGAGICDGLKMGVNTKASVITKSLEELSTLGSALGAHPLTFMGLSGLGDLIVTCTSEHSRNRRFGERIGRGQSIEEAQREIGQVIEGIRATKVAYKAGERFALALPIVGQIYRVLYQGGDPREAVYRFMV